MSKDALTVLREARELISDPKRWTQGAFARNSGGEGISSHSRNAMCWCSAGAVFRVGAVSAGREIIPAFKFLNKAASDLAGDSINVGHYNDTTDHAAVLRMFDAAIASAEKEAEQ